MKYTCIIMAFASLSWIGATAQYTISLKAAIDTALQNNLQVKQERLKAQYQQQLINTAATLPQANLLAEAGQVNSIYTDTKFSIGQSFSFPTVYARQRALLREEWKTSLLQVSVQEALLKRQVAEVYQTILYLEEKRLLLQNADSLFTAFLKKAEQRVSAGESNILEKASATTQQGQVKIQLEELKQDREMLQLQFQLLLNTALPLVPLNNGFKLGELTLQDSSSWKGHPLNRLAEQQQQAAVAGTRLERSRLSPDFSVAYMNQSIRGTGADDKVYGSGKRFNAVQVGIGIPVFSKAQKAKINSARINEQLAEGNYAAGLKTLQTEYVQAVGRYKKYLQTVHYFETTALQNAILITNTANRQLANGNINYLDWTQLVNQAIAVRSNYLEAVKNYNDAVIYLNYFINQ